MLGLKPDPAGQRALNSSVSGAGQSSHCGPQALPTEQQQVERDTASPSSLLHKFRPPGVCWTPKKHEPTRLSKHDINRLVTFHSEIKCCKELFSYQHIRSAMESIRDVVDTGRRNCPVS